jgi:cytochrome P450
LSEVKLENYDPLDPEVIKNPFPYYQLLHRDAPVFKVEKHGFFVVSRYDDVASVLQNWQDFSTTLGPGPAKVASPVASILQSDPPTHTRLRSIISKAFTPRAVQRCEPMVEVFAGECIERMVSQGRTDLVEEYAIPIPVVVMAELLGVPRSDCKLFREWSDAIVAAIGGLANPRESQIDFNTYFGDVIADREKNRGDDMISRLFDSNQKDESLSVPEILAFCLSLLVAGNETTTGLIANLFLELGRRPDQWRRLRENPELVPSAVEEGLRMVGPNQGLFRHTTRDVEMHGVTIPEGTKVLALFGAAGHDATHFPDPQNFDVGRDPNRHLAFGAGIHHCLGASLGRLEANVALRTAVERIEEFRLVVDDPDFVPIFFIRCPERLEVEVIAAG